MIFMSLGKKLALIAFVTVTFASDEGEGDNLRDAIVYRWAKIEKTLTKVQTSIEIIIAAHKGLENLNSDLTDLQGRVEILEKVALMAIKKHRQIHS